MFLCLAVFQIPLYPQADSPKASRETLEKAQHRAAIGEGILAADAMSRMFAFRNQLAAGRADKAAVEKNERETKALIERLHAKWAATPYSSAYEMKP